MTDTDASSAVPPLSIALTTAEQELFAYLLRVREHARCTDANTVVELRVCGGWVRDKLLGRKSSDVDIALDTMTGRAFIECINAFERACGRKDRAAGVMRANPRQSKHVEVATVHLGDAGQVDFVNLRAALFSDPEAEAFGTPEQDAKCRDFTINSLFYNLSTQRIEDFTGQGVCDLRDRVLRTPIDAHDVLLDGLLCALRAVRFAVQLNLQLHASLRAAICLADVKLALSQSVRRERVGREFVRLLSVAPLHVTRGRVGREFVRLLSVAPLHVTRGVQLLDELQLTRAILLPAATNVSVVLADGSAATYVDDDQYAIWRECCACAHEMTALVAAATTSSSSRDSNDAGSTPTVLRLLAAFTLPFAGHRVATRDVSVPVYMLRESLKARRCAIALPSQIARDVDSMVLQHVPLLQRLVHADRFDRVRVALLLREMRALWLVCRDVALVHELIAGSERPSTAQRAAIAARYRNFSASVETSGLVRIWERPLLISGKDVAQELGVKSGVAIRDMLERVFVWQLEHVDKTRADCLAHFRGASA